MEGEFDCQNDRCVGEKMQCDGYNSCGNNQVREYSSLDFAF